jgi:lipopolysaccharide export system permease protein
MGENYELVAIKSSGISLLRFMRPLLILMFIIAGGAFVFNNNVIPVANLKALSLLYNLRNSKPTLNIRAGQFNSDITNYAIKIGSKDEDGRHIKNVIIYDQSSGMGNDNVVLAEKGEMFPSKDKHYLVFRLQNGWRYTEESNHRSMYGNQESIQTRMYFKQYDKIFDLSGFKINNTSQELFKGNYQMLNVAQLAGQIDTIHQNQQREIQISERYISPYVRLASAPEERKKLLEKITSGSKTAGYRNSFLERKYAVALHQKFTLSVACILLFLIGAPLGAIIRKGGLGLPIVVAVAFFVFYHIMSITGEKLAITGTLPPAAGMWLATALLLPIAFFIIRAARNDSQLFSKDFYLRIFDYFKNLFSRYSKSKAI